MASPVNSAAPRSVSFVPAVALIAGAIVLASSPILVRLSELPPTATAFYRVALAVPVIHLLSRYMSSGAGEAQTPLGISSIAAIAAAGALFAADLSFLHWSLRFTSVANSTLFLNLAPCFAGIAGWLLFRQRLSVRFARSLALALFGVVLLIGHPSIEGGGHELLGNLLALSAGACYGGYLIAVGRLRQRIATGPIMTISTFFCALCLWPLAIANGESMVAHTARGWAVLIALALVTHAAGQGLIAFSFRALPANTASSVLLMQPVVAAFASWLVFGERLDSLQILGGVIVLAGVALSQRSITEATPAIPVQRVIQPREMSRNSKTGGSNDGS